MFDQSHDISVLNSLIETTIDSVDGYRHSANEASNQRFSESFRQWAQDREQVVTKLRDRVRQLGGEPEHDGGILAAMHRQFLSLRDKVTGSDDQAVIAEVDRGESYLDEKWQAALNDNELSPRHARSSSPATARSAKGGCSGSSSTRASAPPPERGPAFAPAGIDGRRPGAMWFRVAVA